MNLADAFRNQGKHSEAEAMSCETLTVVRRVLGPERGGETSVVPRGRRCPLFKTHTSGVRTHLWWTVAARRPPRRLIRRSVDNDVAAGHEIMKNVCVRECVCVGVLERESNVSSWCSCKKENSLQEQSQWEGDLIQCWRVVLAWQRGARTLARTPPSATNTSESSTSA